MSTQYGCTKYLKFLCRLYLWCTAQNKVCGAPCTINWSWPLIIMLKKWIAEIEEWQHVLQVTLFCLYFLASLLPLSSPSLEVVSGSMHRKMKPQLCILFASQQPQLLHIVTPSFLIPKTHFTTSLYLQSHHSYANSTMILDTNLSCDLKSISSENLHCLC